MTRKLIITNYLDGIATALFADGKAVELSYDRREDAALIGNIYIGKVANVVKNIQAAFVEIEDGLPCYYPFSENKAHFFVKRERNAPERIIQGDELLVQISRDGVKAKAPTLTSNLSLSGKYLVLTTQKKEICASSKLEPSLRAGLLKEMETLADPRFGWIVRTNAAAATTDELKREADSLAAQMTHIMEIAPYRTARSCVYRNPQPWLLNLKNIYDTEYDQILTDDETIFSQLQSYLGAQNGLDAEKAALYRDPVLPLGKLYPLQSAFEEALKTRVWLKSGAYLVIEPTEALTSIDVNTGKYERGKVAEETFLKINLEAAAEIARQLRLRNLSGMILIDFINMKEKEHQRQLLAELDRCLKRDPVKACVVDMTALGLVEVTRKRMQRPLAEKMGKTGKLA